MLLRLTLEPVREDRARYWVLVGYERRGDRVVAVRKTWEWITPPSGRARFTCTRVTELRRVPGLEGREWPRKMDREPPGAPWLDEARLLAARDAASGTVPVHKRERRRGAA